MDPNQNQPTTEAQPAWQQPLQPPTGYPQPQTANTAPIIAKPTVEDPDQTLGIVSLVLAFMFTPAGLIIGIIALRKSKAAGYKNSFALAGTILSGVITAVAVILIALLIPFAIKGVQELNKKCQELGPGTHQVGSATYECPSSGYGGSVEIK